MNIKTVKRICEKVYNQIGLGATEAAYQRALDYELMSMGVGTTMEYYFTQTYTDNQKRTHVVSNMRADIVVFDWNLIIEVKNVQKISLKDRNQARKYKELSNGMDCVLVNFGYSNLQIELIN